MAIFHCYVSSPEGSSDTLAIRHDTLAIRREISMQKTGVFFFILLTLTRLATKAFLGANKLLRLHEDGSQDCRFGEMNGNDMFTGLQGYRSESAFVAQDHHRVTIKMFKNHVDGKVSMAFCILHGVDSYRNFRKFVWTWGAAQCCAKPQIMIHSHPSPSAFSCPEFSTAWNLTISDPHCHAFFENKYVRQENACLILGE